MEEENLIYINILVSCFVSIFYICRKYCNRNKQSKYTKEIIEKINDLGIGDFTIKQIVEEIKKILPVKLDEEQLKKDDIDLNNIKISISQEL